MKSHAERSANSVPENEVCSPLRSDLPSRGVECAPKDGVSRPYYGLPPKLGLYDPQYEHDSCGVGFVANIKGVRCRQIIDDADRILRHLIHRGATGCEVNTGDGAGMLTGLPHELFQKFADSDLGVELPEPGYYGVGNVFLPRNARERRECKVTVERLIAEQGQQLLGWRPLPTRADGADIGPSARAAEPVIEQLYIGAAPGLDQPAFERQLFVIRKQASRILRTSDLEQALMFFICSLSSKVIVYKGMLTARQLVPYYPDLQDA
ncbi:MAG TPA: glutamate synthase subunit alpha, partial [Planctomycetaceae bacterium]|nr:glutamate synthase subunit alpha [Planctomycetaceae bacterium]